jgi:hypothetical protein
MQWLVILSLYFYNHRNIVAVKDLWSDLKPKYVFFAALLLHGQGAEARRSNQPKGFGLREEAAEVSEARAGQPGPASSPAEMESEASGSKVRASIW